MDKLKDLEECLRSRQSHIMKQIAKVSTNCKKLKWGVSMVQPEFEALEKTINCNINEINEDNKLLSEFTDQQDKLMIEMVDILNEKITNFQKYFNDFGKLVESPNFEFQQKNVNLISALTEYSNKLEHLKLEPMTDYKIQLQETITDSSQFVKKVLDKLTAMKPNDNTLLQNETVHLILHLLKSEGSLLTNDSAELLDDNIAQPDRILQKLNDISLYPLDVKLSGTYYDLRDQRNNETSSNILQNINLNIDSCADDDFAVTPR